jgi:hypothetical protein
MEATTKAVPAFYEPGAPEILPQLLSRTEILLYTHRIPSLIANEELYTGGSSGVICSRQNSTQHIRSQSPYVRPAALAGSMHPPTPKQSNRRVVTFKKPGLSKLSRVIPEEDLDNSPDEDESSSDESDSSTDSELHQDSGIFKIPKPPGEAGRPGSGGYNLKEQLGLPSRYHDELKVRTSLSVLYFYLSHMSSVLFINLSTPTSTLL